MLSIDEAIAKYKEITNTDANCPAHCNISCDKCVQESEQLVEWLEELKEYIKIGTVEGYKNVIDCYTKEYLLRKNLQGQIKEQYNKAIDDAKSVILQTLDNEILVDTLHLRLEQLKERTEK